MADSIEGGDRAEEGKSNSGPSSENDGAVKKKVVRQPNRRHHEKEIQALTEQISAKEAELKSLGRPNIESTPEEVAEKECLLKEQKGLREMKEATIAKRKECDENIHKITDVISKERDLLSQMLASLPHKTERAVDDAIKRFQRQLETQHFTRRDENRIIMEISVLKRAKKKITAYLERRMKNDAEIKEKDEMKKERNIHFRRVSELKAKEDEIRQKLVRMKSKADEAWHRYREAGPQRDHIKKEVDNLYEMRRQLNSEFQAQQREFREYSDMQKIENERRKEGERKAQEDRHRREWFEYEQSREPFEEERVQLDCLVAYLQKLQPKGMGDNQGPHTTSISPVSGPSPVGSVSSVPGSSLGRSSSFKDEEGTFTILRKKNDDDDEVFLQAAASKKKKGRRKSWMNKPLRHSREIFNRFAALDLSAPSTAQEVTEVLDKLKAKLQYYEDAAASVKMAHSAIPNDLSTTSSVSSGIVMAMDMEDMLDSTEEEVTSNDRSGHGSGNEADSGGAQGLSHIQQDVLGGMGDQEVVEDAACEQSAVEVGAVLLPIGSTELSSVDGDRTNSPGTHSSSDDDKESMKLHAKRESSTEESASNGSDDGKEAGNVTDDSESTVVATEGDESGQSSPGASTTSGTISSEGTTGSGPNVNVSDKLVGDEHTERQGVDSYLSDRLIYLKLEEGHGVNDVDKDREDSGMADVQEAGDTSRKGGFVERKNETLRLIVSPTSGGKDFESTKADFVSSSQAECSSDYASNSTGSAVSTPTDVSLLMKREPPLVVEDNALMERVARDPEQVFQVAADADGDWVGNAALQQLSQGALQAHEAALNREVRTAGLESETSSQLLLNKTQL